MRTMRNRVHYDSIGEILIERADFRRIISEIHNFQFSDNIRKVD